MLRTVTSPLLESLPGLRHGFERRLGPNGWETREAGRARVAEALLPDGRLLLLKQVHGARVREAPWDGTPEGDAAVAAAPGLLLGIETADCLPILIVDPQARRVAAVHAGWRGTAASVAPAAVRALAAAGSRPAELRAVLGPCIGPCCYEVGEEVRSAFSDPAPGCFRPGPLGKPHLDLRAANRAQLLAAGLRAEHLQEAGECTRCHPDLYHSYRRDGPAAGRMLSFVGYGARA